MNKVAIVTDSTAYLPKDVREQYRINMIPLNVVFGEKSYQEEIDINVNEFYQKMGEADELPTTSQPAIGQFVSVFEKLQQEGYEQIVTIHLSSKISGTYQAAISASQLVEGIEVIGIDSEISCAPQAQLALEASTIVEKGQGIDTIIERIKEIKDSWNAYFMVDDLNHLHRGGRLNATQLLMGNLLKIKPILHFVDGRIVPFEKVRTEKKAMARIIGMLAEDLNREGSFHVTVIHGNRKEAAEEIAESIRSTHSNAFVDISYFGPVIGTHLGAGSLGVSWYKKS